MENNEISLGQSGKEDFASFLPTKQQKKKTQNKNRKCHTGSDKKAKLLLIIIIIIIIRYSKVSLWI